MRSRFKLKFHKSEENYYSQFAKKFRITRNRDFSKYYIFSFKTLIWNVYNVLIWKNVKAWIWKNIHELKIKYE